MATVRKTEAGEVEGFEAEGTLTWLGIPFAASTAGKNRYRAPQPLSPWKGVRACKAWGPSPPQVTSNGFAGVGPLTSVSEDCLSVNVSVPKGTKPGDKLPVIVWIYGGGHMVGTSSAFYYDGKNLARDGKVVFASINYRVNIFGWQNFSHLSSAEHTFEPNCGLKDQIAGLKWVQKNIANFGGDPGNVTLFGESAGGTAIGAHYCIQESKSLFHRAILLSPAIHCFVDEKQSEYCADQLLRELSVDPSDKAAATKFLLTKSWQQLSKASYNTSLKLQPHNYPGALDTSSVREPGFLETSIAETFAQGRQHPHPMIICNQALEGSLFTVSLKVLPIYHDRVTKMLSQTCTKEQHEQLRKAYDLDKNPGKGSIELGGDSTFWYATVLLAEGHAKAGHSVWVHLNEYAPPLLHAIGLGCTHLFGDIWLYFGNIDKNLGRIFTAGGFWGRSAAVQVSKRLQGHVVDFVNTGVPAKTWTKYDLASRSTLVTTEKEDKNVSDVRKEKRLAWGTWRNYWGVPFSTS